MRMEEWWRGAAEGDKPLHGYYRMLEGAEWAVWRVRKDRQPGGKHLRVMQRISGGDERVKLAVQFQLVD
jgi:hypothetical protein